jgi:uncharacterized RDD family membrane protein YckC
MADPEWYAPPAAEIPRDPIDVDPARLELKLVYGDFLIRVVARLLDLGVSTGLSYAGGMIGGFALLTLANLHAVSSGAVQYAAGRSTALFISASLTGLVYESAAESIGGATVGKWICGLRVLREDLSPCTVGAAIGRNLAVYIDSLFFGLIAFRSMSRSRKKQRLGDRWAKTIVVTARTLPAIALRRNVFVGIAVACALRITLDAISLVVLGVT